MPVCHGSSTSWKPPRFRARWLIVHSMTNRLAITRRGYKTSELFLEKQMPSSSLNYRVNIGSVRLDIQLVYLWDIFQGHVNITDTVFNLNLQATLLGTPREYHVGLHFKTVNSLWCWFSNTIRYSSEILLQQIALTAWSSCKRFVRSSSVLWTSCFNHPKVLY